MNAIAAIKEHLANGRLILFLGADLPAALTGLPSRADLAAGLAQRHGLPAGLSLAAAAQRVMQGGNRFAFTDYLIRQLDTLGKPLRLHQLIARLPIPIIITTAYDNLLEQAFAQAGEPINRVVRDSDLAFADPHRRMLIKLYGDIQQRDTLVVTEDDQLGLWRSREKEGLLDEVRRAMRGNAILFLGYNLADPDFQLLWRDVLDRMGRFALGAYAVSPGLTPDEQQVWLERQVRVIDMDPLALLEQLAATANTGALTTSAHTLTHQEQLPMPTAPTAETIRQQQSLLATHRRTLAILLSQRSQHTSAFAPPSVAHGIAEARTQIRQIKATLRGWGVSVDDEPADTELPDPAIESATPLAPERPDLAIVTAMSEELEPVLELIGGREHWETFLIDKYIHYRASFVFGDTTLNVVACSLWNYGGNPTTAALLRLKSLRPRMIAMTGICAGWDAKGVHLGDVVVADRAFRTREGKLTDSGFEADTQTYQPPPWLVQWLRGFAADKQWFSTITTARPHSLRYQAEWVLCRISERNGSAYPQTDADWDEVSASDIDVERSHDLLLQRGLIASDGTLTEAGQAQIIALRQKQRGKLLPTPDPAQPSVHYGAFASSEAVIAQADPFQEYVQRMRKVRAIDLEVASLFAAAAEIEVPAFAVKGVSDYGTADKDDAFHTYAAEAAARWTYAFVRAHAAALLSTTM